MRMYIYIYIHIHIYTVYIYTHTSLYLFMVMTWGWFRMWVPGSNRFRAPGTQPFFMARNCYSPFTWQPRSPGNHVEKRVEREMVNLGC
jgi:hypothetical protein